MTEITICGHPEPIHFGIFSIKCYCRENNINFETLLNYQSQFDSLDKVVALTIIGLNEGSRRNGSEDRYTEFDVRDLFDDDVELFETASILIAEELYPQIEKLGSLGKSKGGKKPKQKASESPNPSPTSDGLPLP